MPPRKTSIALVLALVGIPVSSWSFGGGRPIGSPELTQRNGDAPTARLSPMRPWPGAFVLISSLAFGLNLPALADDSLPPAFFDSSPSPITIVTPKDGQGIHDQPIDITMLSEAETSSSSPSKIPDNETPKDTSKGGSEQLPSADHGELVPNDVDDRKTDETTAVIIADESKSPTKSFDMETTSVTKSASEPHSGSDDNAQPDTSSVTNDITASKAVVTTKDEPTSGVEPKVSDGVMAREEDVEEKAEIPMVEPMGEDILAVPTKDRKAEVLAKVDVESTATSSSPRTPDRDVSVDNVKDSKENNILMTQSEKMSQVDKDFVDGKERKLEEDEFQRHELTKEQIAWLRKH